MATPLNKISRRYIANSVMRATDLLNRRTELLAQAVAVATAAAKAQLPPGWDKVVAAAADKTWFDHASSVYAGFEEHVFSILSKSSYFEFEPFPVPSRSGFSFEYGPIYDALTPLTAQAKALIEEETTLREQISAYLLSHRTVESATKDMPELAAHMPGHVESHALVVQSSNLLAGLMAAGFKPTA